MVRALESQCVVSEDDCERNLKNALARNLPFCEEMPERTDKLAVVAAGPSVPDYLDEIRKYDHVWAINGAYGYLIGLGIVPEGFVGCDPLPSLAGYFNKAHRDTTFYLSGLCDPAVFDVLESYDVRLWFPVQDAVPHLKKLPTVGGGTTAVTRAPFLAKFLGFRDVTLYGVDSSFNGSRYCYPDGTFPDDSVAPVSRVVCNGEGPFFTEMCLMKQVSQLGVMATHQTWGVDFKIRCHGLMAAYLRAPLETDADL